MTFRWPLALVFVLLVPVLALAYGRAVRRGAARTQALSAHGLIVTGAPSRVGRVVRHLPAALFGLALTALLVALARPEATVSRPRREGTVILAVDVSTSMRADDVKPTRLDAAKAASSAFVERQPAAVRIGVVAFGDGAVVVQQPTTVHADVEKALKGLTPDGGTSLGQGLVTALSAIAGKPVVIDEKALASDGGEVDVGYFGSGTVVLLTDGENQGRPDPADVAQVASVAGVHVHTVGVGTTQGAVVKVDGFSEATALDEALLQQIATTTDGSYHAAGDPAAATAIAKTIDLRFKVVSEHLEITGVLSAAGAALLVLGAFLSILRSGRVV